MKHLGNLTITAANAAQYAALTSVTGGLSVQAEGASFPALTKTGGLDVGAEGASFPALTSVTGWLDVGAEGASFPALTSVTGWLDVWAEGASFPLIGEVIAFSTWGLVWWRDGKVSAGCHGQMSVKQALAHWNRHDARARIYSAALAKLEEGV